MSRSIYPHELELLLERARLLDPELATLADFIAETGLCLEELDSLEIDSLRHGGKLRVRSDTGCRDVELTDRAWMLLVRLALPTTRKALAQCRKRWQRLGRPLIESELQDLAALSLYRELKRLGWK